MAPEDATSAPVKQDPPEDEGMQPSTAAAASSSVSHNEHSDPKGKRARTSRPKVKTGCNNCKQRRIKCDELRPSCSNCLRSKKKCSGYPPPARSARPFEEIPIAPKPVAPLAPSGEPAAVPVVKPRLPQAILPPRRQRPTPSGSHPPPPPPTLAQAAGPAGNASVQQQPVLQSSQTSHHPLSSARRQPQASSQFSYSQRSQQQPPQQSQLPPQQPYHQVVRPLTYRQLSQFPQFHQLQAAQPDETAREQQQHRRQIQQSARRLQKMYQRRNTAAQTPMTAYIPTFVYNPTVGLPFSQQEGLYFQLFRTHTANELSGFFDDVFWSRTVLVECHSEAAIRHAVVALGALYKTLEKTTESPPNSPSDSHDATDNVRRHWEVALWQYASACAALRAVTAENERTQRTSLMATVLLACFDSFIGDHKQAIIQIQTGLALLERLRVERRRSLGPRSNVEPVEDELTQMFTRLAIQAKSYDMAFHFPQPYVIRLLPQGASSGMSEVQAGAGLPASPPESSDIGSPVSTHQEPIPSRFATLREARISWDTLCEHMLRFTEVMFQFSNGPPNILPQSMTRFGIQFKTRIQAWSDAFESLLAGRFDLGVSFQEKAGIAVLKMTQIMGQILYLMTFSDSEMQFDAFRPQFKAIVDLAFEVVGDEECRAAAVRCPDPAQCFHHDSHHYQQQPQSWGQNSHPNQQPQDAHKHNGFDYRASHIKASFSADLGIVPPLFVVATKSRDHILRRQAIQLLRSSARREGMWDSELMAHICMWVVGIEERGEEEECMSLMRHNSAGTSIPLTPADSPISPSTLPSTVGQPRSGSVNFGESPLGPGGNARWDLRRESQGSSSGPQPFPPDPNVPYYMRAMRPIPAEKRVLIRACEFDLREHKATLKCGTRGLALGAPDQKYQHTDLRW